MQKVISILRDVITPLVVLMTCGFVAYDHFVPKTPAGPRLVVDGVALGRVFAPSVSASLADAWTAAADALEQGKTVSEAQVALQNAWQDARVKAFTAKVAPEFARVLSEGSEPSDPAKRAEVVKLWRDFALGLKGGH